MDSAKVAIKDGDVDQLRQLLRSGKVSVIQRDQHHHSLIMMAILADDLDIVKLLTQESDFLH